MPARRKVVVIDDDQLVADSVVRALRSFDVEVVKLNRAFGALNAVAEHRPALVIVDVMMPGLAGTELTALIRTDPDLRSTRVLLHSALDEDTLAKKAAECGADGYLLKTAGPSATQRKLTRWLSA